MLEKQIFNENNPLSKNPKHVDWTSLGSIPVEGFWIRKHLFHVHCLSEPSGLARYTALRYRKEYTREGEEAEWGGWGGGGGGSLVDAWILYTGFTLFDVFTSI